MKRLLGLMATVLLFGSIGEAKAAIITAQDMGWYRSDGLHDSTNPNYIVGNLGLNTFHDFFVFDLMGQTNTITSATFAAFNPSSGNTITASTTYTLSEVVTSIPTLVAGGTGLVGIYTDLANGTVYGSVTVNPGDTNQFISVTLNGAGVAAINSNLGGKIAFGGSLPDAATGFVFGFSGDTAGRLDLQSNPISAVPEPATMTMLGFGIAGMLGFGIRRRRTIAA